jgi:hypothetical protein
VSNDVKRLIEKFGLAIHGEDPQNVLNVLVHYVSTLCTLWRVDPQQFVDALLADDFRKILVPLNQKD